MHDEYRAGGVLDDVSADRSEQESDEPAEATTADDEHRRTLRRIKEHPRGVAIFRGHVESSRRGVTENLPDALLNGVPAHVLPLFPVQDRKWHRPVGERIHKGILPSDHDLNRRIEGWCQALLCRRSLVPMRVAFG